MSAATKLSGRIESAQPDALTRLKGEVWLARRLLRHDVDALAGVTDNELDRKARFRDAIKKHGLEVVTVGSHDQGRKPITYAAAFERLYGEPL